MPVSRLSRLLVVGALAAIGCVVPATTADAALQPLVITTTDLPDAPVGTPYTATLKATGGNFGRVWSLTEGTLPSGLKLSAQGRITGSPQVEGPAAFTVSVRDLAIPRHTATAVIALTVAPMRITTASLPVFTEGIKTSTQLTALGGTKPYAWSVAPGQLPYSITLSSSGRLSGYGILGGSTYDITVQVTDKNHRTAVRSYELVVEEMKVTTTTVPAAKKNRFYSVKMKSYGGCVNPGWSVHDANGQGPGSGQGILPNGLRIQPGSGYISGIPKTAGSYAFTVLALCGSSFFIEHAWSDVLTLTVS